MVPELAVHFSAETVVISDRDSPRETAQDHLSLDPKLANSKHICKPAIKYRVDEKALKKKDGQMSVSDAAKVLLYPLESGENAQIKEMHLTKLAE